MDSLKEWDHLRGGGGWLREDAGRPWHDCICLWRWALFLNFDTQWGHAYGRKSKCTASICRLFHGVSEGVYISECEWTCCISKQMLCNILWRIEERKKKRTWEHLWRRNYWYSMYIAKAFPFYWEKETETEYKQVSDVVVCCCELIHYDKDFTYCTDLMCRLFLWKIAVKKKIKLVKKIIWLWLRVLNWIANVLEISLFSELWATLIALKEWSTC